MHHKQLTLYFNKVLNAMKLKQIFFLLLLWPSWLIAGQAVSGANVASTGPMQSLYDIYLEAKQNDPSLASAHSANQAAQELIEQAKANYRPSVNLNASATASRTNVKFIGTNNPFRGGSNRFEGYSSSVEARQPIFRKENWERINQSETQVSISDKQYHLAQQDLMLRTTQAYFDVLLAQDQFMLIEAQKAAILSQLDQAKATFQVGTATITDVNEAQARYDLIVAQELSAKKQY